MFRIAVVLTIAALGAAIGIFVGLVSGIGYLEFANNSCSVAQCTDIIARVFVPVSSVLGGLLGLAKGLNMTMPRIRNLPV